MLTQSIHRTWLALAAIGLYENDSIHSGDALPAEIARVCLADEKGSTCSAVEGQKPIKRGHWSNGKTSIVATVEKNGNEFGRIRVQTIPDCSCFASQAFINDNIAPDSSVITCGWIAYQAISTESNTHNRQASKHIDDKDGVIPSVHRIASLLRHIVLKRFNAVLAQTAFWYTLKASVSY